MSGSLSCVQALLKARAHVNARDEDHMRPLHFAALSGELQIAMALMVSRADPLRVDDEQRGPTDCLPEDLRRQPLQLRRWTDALERGRAEKSTNNGSDSDREQDTLTVAADGETAAIGSALPVAAALDRMHLLGTTSFTCLVTLRHPR